MLDRHWCLREATSPGGHGLRLICRETKRKGGGSDGPETRMILRLTAGAWTFNLRAKTRTKRKRPLGAIAQLWAATVSPWARQAAAQAV